MLNEETLDETLDQMPLTLIVLTPDEVEQRLAAGDQFLKEILTRGRVLYARC